MVRRDVGVTDIGVTGIGVDAACVKRTVIPAEAEIQTSRSTHTPNPRSPSR